MSISTLPPLRRAVAVALAGAMIMLGGCVLGQVHLERETRTMTAAHVADSPVVVRTTNGEVSVTADSARSDVTITAELRAQTLDRLSRTKVLAARDPQGILRIEIAWADGKALNSEGCDFDIVVPDARDIDIDTSNGKVEVAGLSGRALLRSSNGRITAANHAGDVDANTSNGAIVIRDPQGNVRAKSSNGAIDIDNAPTRVDADSSNGRITITLTNSSTGPVIADTSNGAIYLTVGTGFMGVLSLDSSNASITTESFERRPDAKITSLKKSSGTIVFGSGGEPSSCSTSNGHVSVKVREN